MTLLPVIFEDQTLVGFRPLSWTVPVCELRCGILNPRERLRAVCGQDPALLLRTLLEPLACDAGHAVGSDPLRAPLAAGARLLLVSGRLGSSWDLLEEAHRLARAGEDLAWRDAEGWLAVSATGDPATALLDAWDRWRAEADAAGCWRAAGVAVPDWEPEIGGNVRTVAGAWGRIWDLVPATAAAIAADLERLAGELPERHIWGAVPVAADGAFWAEPVQLAAMSSRTGPADGGPTVLGEHPVLVGPGCDLAPGICLDARSGPVVLGRQVTVLPHSYLAGPVFVGSGAQIKAGATIYGETSIGAVCKVGGEVGETTMLDFGNKQHEGFIGHAYLGSWVNLGALTTCSDLKNTYGEIRVDLGAGPEPSGQRFVGVLMGEHARTAIGTLFNTGTTVGFASNVFGTGFPEKALPCFTWGDGRDETRQDPRRALEVAGVAMGRRGCQLTSGHEGIFTALGS